MKKLSVFEFVDYRVYLQKAVELGGWGALTRMAKAADCQRSYLSRVLKGTVHLTPDHAYKLSQHLKLPSPETEYFLTIVEQARASSSRYRDFLGSKIGRLRQANEKLDERLSRKETVSEAGAVNYYSSWQWSAIHILLTIPGFSDPRSISQRLSIPEALVLSILRDLKKMGLVSFRNGKWQRISGDIHLPRESPLVSLHHGNWRQRAVLDSQQSKESIHYTAIHSMSTRAFLELKKELLASIDRSAEISGPSPCEELVCMALDFFVV